MTDRPVYKQKTTLKHWQNTGQVN